MQISDSKRRIIGCKISEIKQKVDILEKIYRKEEKKGCLKNRKKGSGIRRQKEL